MGLAVGILFSAVGTGYLIYGKRQQSAMFLVAGAVLAIYPIFIDNAWLSALIGTVVSAFPIAAERGLF